MGSDTNSMEGLTPFLIWGYEQMNKGKAMIKIIKHIFLIIGCVAVFSSKAFAYLDTYTVTAPANMMKGDSYSITVNAYHHDGTSYDSGHLIQFVLPAGVQCIGGNVVSISNGVGTYTLSIGADATPRAGTTNNSA